MSNNIFNYKKGDATAYLFFYIIIPILVTYISLRVFPSDIASGMYCYVTILMSILNGIYDAAGRWLSGIASRRNAKILAIWSFNGIVGIYCFYVIFSVLIAKNINCRKDWILLAYGGTVLVALWDAGVAFLKHVTLRKEIGGADI